MFIRLHSSKDLAEITELAQDRKCWSGLTSRIEKAAGVHRLKTGTRNSNKSSQVRWCLKRYDGKKARVGNSNQNLFLIKSNFTLPRLSRQFAKGRNSKQTYSKKLTELSVLSNENLCQVLTLLCYRKPVLV